MITSLAFLILAPRLDIKIIPHTNAQIKAVEENKAGDSRPVKVSNFEEAAQISARSAIVIDSVSGKSLFEKDPDLAHLPASTTKLMTALVALEKCTPEDVIKVDRVEKDGTQMGLSAGDEVNVEGLLYGLLVSSGNDAAYALAGGCSSSSGEFIEKMNSRAKELGMTKSHFDNPAGFDSQFQYSTARDLAKLARVAIANPLILKIVGVKSTVVVDVWGLKTYYLENINKLLGVVNGLDGVKTGHTDGSGEILIAKTTRANHTIISVILGSEDRFEETTKLIDWTFGNYNWD
jgi:D-alanyl-D-alanine carboxypeptidase